VARPVWLQRSFHELKQFSTYGTFSPSSFKASRKLRALPADDSEKHENRAFSCVFEMSPPPRAQGGSENWQERRFSAVFEDLRVTAPRETRHPKNSCGRDARDGLLVAESTNVVSHERPPRRRPPVSTGRQAIARPLDLRGFPRGRSPLARPAQDLGVVREVRTLAAFFRAATRARKSRRPEKANEVANAQSVRGWSTKIGASSGDRMVVREDPGPSA